MCVRQNDGTRWQRCWRETPLHLLTWSFFCAHESRTRSESTLTQRHSHTTHMCVPLLVVCLSSLHDASASCDTPQAQKPTHRVLSLAFAHARRICAHMLSLSLSLSRRDEHLQVHKRANIYIGVHANTKGQAQHTIRTWRGSTG